MKPIREEIPAPISYSFSTEYIRTPCFKSKWHYHEHETELIYIVEGKGTGFVGDGATFFSGGELALIGAMVPHVWLNTKKYYKPDSNLIAKAIVIKFDENFLGNQFLSLPGFLKVKDLILNRSRKGLMILGIARQKVARMIESIVDTSSDFDRVMYLIQILNIVSNTDEYEYVSKTETIKIPRSSDLERLEKVIKYVNENYQDRIELEKVAELANMTPSAFCKYFKKRTLKTFTQFLNEVRIGNACKLLTEKELSVKQVCYMSGFNYLSNFYKQFHAIHSMSPLDYKEKLFTSELNPGL
jgi:AraC-like DNA-binding protein